MKREIVEILEEEKKSGFHFKTVDKLAFANELLLEIGNLDSHIRDELIYPNLAHLFHDNHFTEEQLHKFLYRLLSKDYLFYDMENKENYSVLKRSFTTLQLVIFVFVFNRDNLFSREIFKRIFDSFMSYFKLETVLTGYGKEVGWMHSIAHCADMFAQLVKSNEIDANMLEEMFHIIKEKFLIDSYNYVSDEDERMVTAIVNALNRDLLSKEFLIQFVASFEAAQEPPTFPEKYVFKNNKKNLLRALYFRIIKDEKYQFLTDELEAAIIKIQSRR